eukprot:TRINITY_DN2643_c0_g1_i1.p1 TRINITY_DN2643_c0_g1~~TRINITY_DN2643_c0_g1_i1.p1  ORF type:complete len:719 (-),score=263.43 TRINITY_DN2643_c0_g1_i1:205-2361(-)
MLEFKTDLILDELTDIVNNELKAFAEIYDSEYSKFFIARISSDITKGDFSVSLKSITGRKRVNLNEYSADLCEKYNEYLSSDNNNNNNNNEGKNLIQRVEFINGFLNIFLDRPTVFKAGMKVINEKKENFGKCSLHKGKKAIVEHTSANPNGPLHVGNLRTAVLGSHLSKLLEWVGYEVKQHYFVNDLGAQIGTTVLGFSKIYNKIEPTLKIDQWIGIIYAVMNTLSDTQKQGIDNNDLLYKKKEDAFNFFEGVIGNAEDPKKIKKLKDLQSTYCSLYERFPVLVNALNEETKDLNIHSEAAELNLRYEENESGAVKLFRSMVINCLSGTQQTLDHFDIKHDCFDFESELGWEGSNDVVMETLTKSPYFVPPTKKHESKQEGGHLLLSNFISDSGFKIGKKGYSKDFPNFYVLRVDGSTLYTFRDVVYSIKKVKQADLVLNVIASEQNLPQEKVNLTLQLLGLYEAKNKSQIHVSYEIVKLLKNGNEVKMSGRRGQYVRADDLYNELKEEGQKFILSRAEEKNKPIDLNDPKQRKFVEQTSHELASASTKYALLGTGTRHIIKIDIDKVVNGEDKTASFILYNAVRFNSLNYKFQAGLDKGIYQPLPETLDDYDYSLLDEPTEWYLFMKYIIPFPNTVLSAACPNIPLSPQLPEYHTNRLIDYCDGLAREYSKYYKNNKILIQDNQEKLAARLLLSNSLKTVLFNAMNILTIKPLDKM